MKVRTVMLAVETATDEDFAKVFELLTRHAVGFELDGFESRVFSSTDE